MSPSVVKIDEPFPRIRGQHKLHNQFQHNI